VAYDRGENWGTGKGVGMDWKAKIILLRSRISRP